MKRLFNHLPPEMLRDEAQMRAFYASCGISERVIQAAIDARRKNPVAEEKAKKSAAQSRRKRRTAG
jgi:hypothetical protein